MNIKKIKFIGLVFGIQCYSENFCRIIELNESTGTSTNAFHIDFNTLEITNNTVQSKDWVSKASNIAEKVEELKVLIKQSLYVEILDSTRYVNLIHQKEPWFQLEVVNMWNFKAKPICFSYVGKTLISYILNKNTKINNNSYNSTIISKLSTEMKQTLVKNGYTLK